MPQPPHLEYVCSFFVNIGLPLVVGQTPRGLRRIVPILGGHIEGPLLQGEIMAGGADWQYVRADGVTELEAHYQLKMPDGTLIYFKNTGIRVASEEVGQRLAAGELVPDDAYYFRTIPLFEAPTASPYNWLNQCLFISKATRQPDHVVVEIWQVL
ncbi:MAG: DUF3237 domain-containing protein [Spirosomaceae bacterium]|jgi:hypothetical protein|nr:DUF3237 domain-containing protein [Spirosomataceae bacterium]